MILVTGGTGYTGRLLVRRLVGLGRPVRCLVRPTSERAELDGLGVDIVTGDLDDPDRARGAFAGVRYVFHLAHIRFASTLAACLSEGVERAVLVSSLRRFSRVPSASVGEVIAGERAAEEAGTPCTVLRPSMIYGPGDDRNISRLAARLRRHPLIPVFGGGRPLQQPVYVDDVVDAVLAAAERPEAAGKGYALAGPHALSYNQMIDLVGAALGVRPVKLHLPVAVGRAALWALRRVGISPGIDAEQILRLQEDKAVSIAAARQDLNFAPVSFEAGLARIYGRCQDL